MAQRVNNNTGNWSSATLWDSMSSAMTLHASTNVTVTGTIYSAAFTAPSIVNFSTGVGVNFSKAGTAGTMAFTLQEYNGAAWLDTAATASAGVTDITAGSYLYLRWGTAYQYTTTTAGRYRVKIVMTGGSGTTQLSADAAGTAFGYFASDDRVSALAATDDVYVCGDGTTARTVTVDNTSAQCGNATSTSLVTARLVGCAVTVGISGTLAWSNAASSTLTAKGSLVAAGGKIEMGSVASPISSSYVATLAIDENGTGGNFGIGVFFGALSKFEAQGASRTSWEGTYKSGAGTAASPLITNAAIDLAVNDEIWIAPTEGYAQGETRYVITVNSPTSYVVSSTIGGAETALTYTHDDGADILSVTRNVVIKTTNAAHGLYFLNENTTSGNVNADWARFENVGSSSTGKNGIYMSATSTGVYSNFDYCVAYNVLYHGFVLNSNPGNKAYTNLASGFNKSMSTSNGYCFFVPSANKSLALSDWYAVDFGRNGMTIGGQGHTFSGSFKAIGCSQQNAAGFGIAFAASKVSCTGMDVYSNRGYGVGILGVVASRFVGPLVGTKGSNDAADIYAGTDTYNDAVMVDPYFGSATFVSNYLGQVSGSKLRFHRKNGVPVAHFIYTAEGIEQATGTGLADTNVRTASSYGFRMAPEDATTGCSYSFKVLAEAGKGVSVFGFAQMSAALSGDAAATVTVNIYLPGSLTPDSSITLAKTALWQYWNVGASYTGANDELAKVEVVVKSATAAAYLYLDDLYNGTNRIISFDTWDEGEPSPVMFQQLGDPYATWAALESFMTTPGTMGYKLSNLEDSVWNEPNSAHVSSGTTGKKLSDGLTKGQYIAL